MRRGRRFLSPRLPRPGGVHWLSPADNITDHADVVIVGGGATGVGILWDLTLRGLDVILIEQAGLASGTSGAFHGLLHSGGRYAGSDPETAAECLAENGILKSVAASFIHDTGGIFVRLEDDDPEWEKRWLDGCRRVGLKAHTLDPRRLSEDEPTLSSRIVSAYGVPDAAVDGFGLLWSLVWSAAEAGARAYFRTRVTDLLTDDDGVRGVRVVGLGGTEEGAVMAVSRGEMPAVEPGEIIAGVVVNATGPWAADTAALAGPEVGRAVPVERDKGVMIVFNSRLAGRVVNRLRPPTDGDILVPHGPVSIFGTTSRRFSGPGRPEPETDEIRVLMEQGRALVPDLDRAAPLRAYAGVRPLLTSGESSPAGSVGPRGMGGVGRGRGFLLLDHGTTGGPAGLITAAGGKFTTFRAMAEATGDLVSSLLDRKRPCRTAEVGVPRLSVDPQQLPACGPGGAGGDPDDLGQPLACECEFVNVPRLLTLIDAGLGLSDLRRLFRVGMGGCQGVFCGRRLAGALADAGWPGNRGRPQADPSAIRAETAAFRRGRIEGVRSVQWGSQARLSALADALERFTIGETHSQDSPDEGSRGKRENASGEVSG